MAIAAPDAAQKRLHWTSHYWLCHCEGYRVDTRDGHLGFVEEVAWGPEGAEPLGLSVRTGFDPPRVVVVPVDDVLEVSPTAERIVVAG